MSQLRGWTMFHVGKTVKFFNKDTLIGANREAIFTNRNRTLNPEAIAGLPELNFPVVFEMVHNDHEMRVGIMVGPHAAALQMVFLDIPFSTFEKLPSVEVNRE